MAIIIIIIIVIIITIIRDRDRWWFLSFFVARCVFEFQHFSVPFSFTLIATPILLVASVGCW